MASHDRKIVRDRATLASNIQRLRAARGATQEKAAELAGLHWRHWQKIEHGEINVTLTTLSKIAAALAVDVAALLAPLR